MELALLIVAGFALYAMTKKPAVAPAPPPAAPPTGTTITPHEEEAWDQYGAQVQKGKEVLAKAKEAAALLPTGALAVPGAATLATTGVVAVILANLAVIGAVLNNAKMAHRARKKRKHVARAVSELEKLLRECEASKSLLKSQNKLLMKELYKVMSVESRFVPGKALWRA